MTSPRFLLRPSSLNSPRTPLSKHLLSISCNTPKRWNFELRHRMQPQKAPESTRRKAKLHICDTRLDETDKASIMYNLDRSATDSYIDLTQGQEPSWDLSAGGEAVRLLYKDFDEPYSQHRKFVYFNKSPPTRATATPFVAPSATLIGDVFVQDGASIWYDAVLRADLNKITIGSKTSIQDGVTITTDDRPTKTGRPAAVFVGNETTIGPNCRLHSCRIDDQVIVGPNCIVLEGARMHQNSILEANSVLLPGQIVGSWEVWAGNPAKKVRSFSMQEMEEFADVADVHVALARVHHKEFAGEGADVAHVRQAEQLRDYFASWMPESPKAPMHWGVWDMLHEFKRRFTPEYYTWSYFYDPVENTDPPGRKVK